MAAAAPHGPPVLCGDSMGGNNGTNGYLSLDDLRSIPRLEAPFYWLRPDDYAAWRQYAYDAAVAATVPQDKRRRVATLIAECPDPRTDGPMGELRFEELRTLVPGLQSLTERASEGLIGKPIRLRALTSAEWYQAQRMAQQHPDHNVQWYVTALGMHTPSLGADEDIDSAIAIVQEWPQTNVHLISDQITKLTFHPRADETERDSYKDSYQAFFDGAA